MSRRGAMTGHVRNGCQHESTWQASEAVADAESAWSMLCNAVYWASDYFAGGEFRRFIAARGSLETGLHYVEKARRRLEEAWLRVNDADAPKSAPATLRRADRYVTEIGDWLNYAVAGWNAERSNSSSDGGERYYRAVRSPRLVEIERSRLEDLFDRLDQVLEDAGHGTPRSGRDSKLRDQLVKAARDWDGSF